MTTWNGRIILTRWLLNYVACVLHLRSVFYISTTDTLKIIIFYIFYPGMKYGMIFGHNLPLHYKYLFYKRKLLELWLMQNLEIQIRVSLSLSLSLSLRLHILPLPCAYTFSLKYFIVNNTENFKSVQHYITLIQGIHTILTDQPPIFITLWEKYTLCWRQNIQQFTM